MLFTFVLLLGLAQASDAPDPVLSIRSPTQVHAFKRSELIARKDLKTLEIDYDPTFPGKKLTYHAVPLHALFEGISIPDDATLQFKCLDGFSAPIDKKRLLNASEGASVAYLAIEMPDEKWPAVGGKGERTAAPFYLVWVNPKASKIGPEEWPYQLSGFETRQAIEKQFPLIFPEAKLAKKDAAWRGVKVFTKNCFTCHTLNLEGESAMGPDLNVPMSPTEYMTPKGLRTLIRDPANLRRWPQAKMDKFDLKAISEAELDDLVAYLKYMSRHKRN